MTDTTREAGRPTTWGGTSVCSGCGLGRMRLRIWSSCSAGRVALNLAWVAVSFNQPDPHRPSCRCRRVAVLRGGSGAAAVVPQAADAEHCPSRGGSWRRSFPPLSPSPWSWPMRSTRWSAVATPSTSSRTRSGLRTRSAHRSRSGQGLAGAHNAVEVVVRRQRHVLALRCSNDRLGRVAARSCCQLPADSVSVAVSPAFPLLAIAVHGLWRYCGDISRGHFAISSPPGRMNPSGQE